jgi:hypothetical protein
MEESNLILVHPAIWLAYFNPPHEFFRNICIRNSLAGFFGEIEGDFKILVPYR